MRLPDEIKKCVFFLCVKDGGRYKYGGTGFFLTSAEKIDTYFWWTYLVTARHSVKRALERYGTLYARFNRKDGTAVTVELPNNWVYPDRESSDVAVMPFQPDSDIDYGPAPGMMAATEEEIEKQNIGIGDELVVVGLFSQRHGKERNIPIVRSGIIAAMPEEPLIDSNSGEEYDAFLAEVRSIGGLSGSPVFVPIQHAETNRPRFMVRLTHSFYLLGLIRGHWDLKSNTSGMDFADDFDGKLNMGVATVTPIQEVIDLISKDDDLKAKRKADLKEYERSREPALDSGFDEPNAFTKEDFEAALKKVSRKLDTPK